MFSKMRHHGFVWHGALAAGIVGLFVPAIAMTGPVNPQMFKQKFDDAKKNAEVVAEVRVLAAACTEAAGEGKEKSVTLQLSLQVLSADKGPAKKNEVIVVTQKVNLPAGPGPG